MAQAVPTQHPAVVLRSHYLHVRTLLAIAMIGLVGLTIAVVVLATDEGAVTVGSATPASAPADRPDGPRQIHAPGQGYERAPADAASGVR